jgi:hypothetical protein
MHVVMGEAEVIIVVDRDASVPIVDLARRAAVWASRTLETETAAVEARQMGGEVTLFDAAGEPEPTLLGIVDEVALHHGEHALGGPVSALEVVGTPASNAVRARFEALGFSQFDPTPDGFVAWRA